MQAYKCDRCGKFYTDNDYSKNYYVTKTPNIPANCLDLCNDCYGELHEWLKSGIVMGNKEAQAETTVEQ